MYLPINTQKICKTCQLNTWEIRHGEKIHPPNRVWRLHIDHNYRLLN